jgi:hypothetical protein
MRKLIKILGNKSGASMVIVLAVMFLLISIIVSVLAAAGESTGAGLNQYKLNQMNMYAESVQRVIMEVLPDTSVDFDVPQVFSPAQSNLGGQLVREILTRSAVPDFNMNDGFDLEDLAIQLDGAAIPVTIAVEIRNVVLTPAAPVPPGETIAVRANVAFIITASDVFADGDVKESGYRTSYLLSDIKFVYNGIDIQIINTGRWVVTAYGRL